LKDAARPKESTAIRGKTSFFDIRNASYEGK
jgi:hypothetical protein